MAAGNSSKILNFLKTRTINGASFDEIATALKTNSAAAKTALRYLKQKGYVEQSDEYFWYVGRFVRIVYNTCETRANPINRAEILQGHDSLLSSEEIPLMNLTDEEFLVTFARTDVEGGGELAKRFAFVVNEETNKKVWKLNKEGSAILKRPILEKKSFNFDQLMPRQTKKYYLEFVVDRDYIEKVPNNSLTCALKINCISLNYHDFFEMAIQLYPGWY